MIRLGLCCYSLEVGTRNFFFWVRNRNSATWRRHFHNRNSANFKEMLLRKCNSAIPQSQCFLKSATLNPQLESFTSAIFGLIWPWNPVYSWTKKIRGKKSHSIWIMINYTTLVCPGAGAGSRSRNFSIPAPAPAPAKSFGSGSATLVLYLLSFYIMSFHFIPFVVIRFVFLYLLSLYLLSHYSFGQKKSAMAKKWFGFSAIFSSALQCCFWCLSSWITFTKELPN